MNTRKIIYSLTGLIIAAFLLYNSVYLTRLSERNKILQTHTFDPKQAVDEFWKDAPEKLQEKALDMIAFDQQLSENTRQLAEKYGKTLGIGAPYSLLVKGKAVIAKVNDETITLSFDSQIPYSIRTGYIFSNTVREASGHFNLDEFDTTMDFNLIAVEINQRIVKEIIAPVKSQLIKGNTIEFLGAVDINLRRLPVRSIEILPLQLLIIQP